MLLLKNTLKSTIESLFLLSLLGAFTPTHAMKDDEKEEGAPRSVPTLKNIVKDKVLAQGNPNLNYELARQFKKGQGCKKDFRMAVSFYYAAADLGHAGAQYKLGKIYNVGKKFLNKNHALAVYYFELASGQGHAGAQYNLALKYASGRGVTKNDVKASQLYRQAAEQGHVNAQFNLAVRYETGTGLKKDEKKAAEWYQKAAIPHAHYKLGWMYEEGRGVPVDAAKARQYLRYYYKP